MGNGCVRRARCTTLATCRYAELVELNRLKAALWHVQHAHLPIQLVTQLVSCVVQQAQYRDDLIEWERNLVMIVLIHQSMNKRLHK